MDENWVKVFSSSFLAQAEINKAMLIENDVAAVVLNKLDSSYLAFGQAEIYVHPDNELRAKQLLEQEVSLDDEL
ncbi:MAG: DUF2007 domain-containing protein [Bacteroidetes bacterium]|nr:DUF2007 domain-containing protein [Bacteroidota bacterium]